MTWVKITYAVIVLALLLLAGCNRNVPTQLGLNPEKAVIGDRYFYFESPDTVQSKSPVIIMLHGRSQTALGWFDASEPLATDGQVEFTTDALANGFAVIAPQSGEAFCPGKNQWDSTANSEDVMFVQNILEWVKQNPRLDTSRVYVVGLSSGATMTSRIGIDVGKDTIKAIAIHSGANADEATLAYNEDKVFKCEVSFSDAVPTLSSAHPKTLLIHGRVDNIVPVSAAEAYDQGLANSKIEHKLIVKGDGRHTWYPEYNDDILLWFS